MFSDMSLRTMVAILPICVLGVGTLLLLLGDLFNLVFTTSTGSERRSIRALWCITICICAWILALPSSILGQIAQSQPQYDLAYLKGSLYVDSFSLLFVTLILASTVIYFLLSSFSGKFAGITASADVDALVMLSVIGAISFVQAGDLAVLFVGLELMSISIYVLAGTARSEKASSEAALKYFILGAFSSALFLYGIALIYGASGTLQLNEISWSAPANSNMLKVGIGLMILGFAFKLGVFPLHSWVPDVYQGSPTTVTVFMATVVKIAAVGAMLRVMVVAFGDYHNIWSAAVLAIAIGSMIAGNLGALRQTSLKRMLAYSSIAHAGYLLLGMSALGKSEGGEAIIFYTLVYSLMTVVTFGVLLLVTGNSVWQYERDDLQQFAGFGWKSPFLALMLSVGIFSLAGLPPLAGFMAKFYIFKAVIDQGYYWSAIIAALNSFVALYYYLRVIVVMYFGSEETSPIAESGAATEREEEENAWGGRIAIATCGILLLVLGVCSDQLLQCVNVAMHSL